MKKKSTIQRVDIQVALLVSILVVLSSSIVYYYSYSQSYAQMINSLKDRVNSIALYVDENISSSIFTEITSANDMHLPAYAEAKKLLSEVRDISCAQYLYTATTNEEGKLIYHIDGLAEDDQDFRKPGHLIEPDFQADLLTALKGKIVMPGVIKNTEWGDVFVAYYPVHDKDTAKTIGAIGLEFPANREYKAFQKIRRVTPIIILITCIVAFFISRYLFRRISNPHFKDLSNTDFLTGLKNHNAFALDIENLIEAGKTNSYTLVLADLNSLKAANDQFGHKAGDEYIKNFARALSDQANDNHITYRIGGDEFAIFFFDASQSEVEDFIIAVKNALIKHAKASIPFCSAAIGYAMSDKLTYETWEKTQIEADKALYLDKKEFYQTHQKCDNRR